jgi:NitT/TauT family transport system ATP-binding protein
LSVDNVGHTFHAQGGSISVFENISFDILPGDFVSVLGPSGCGKSTLLQIIAGLLRPASGRVTFEGQPVLAPPKDMIYLFQQYNKSLLPWRTVLANVAFALEGRGISRKERRAQALDYLRVVGLEGFGDHYPWHLSGGMQQRVAIARALAAQPKVLLLDEPFSAVDALTRIGLQTLVLDIWEKAKLTVVLVTHDVDEAVFMASRILMLQNRPATIARSVETDLPRPRDAVATREMPRFLELRHELLNVLLKKH